MTSFLSTRDHFKKFKLGNVSFSHCMLYTKSFISLIKNNVPHFDFHIRRRIWKSKFGAFLIGLTSGDWRTHNSQSEARCYIKPMLIVKSPPRFAEKKPFENKV